MLYPHPPTRVGMTPALMRLTAFGLILAQPGSCVVFRGDSATNQSHVLRGRRSDVGATSDRSNEKPHIVFVLADDLGYNGVGYNNADIKTPTIDKLAKGGVTLNRYYAAPICGPSRFSLLTGRLPWKSEAWMSYQFQFGTPSGTSLGYTLLPATLKTAGYATHMVGKWHQGYYEHEYYPQNRGFDTFYGTLEGCVYHDTQQLCEVSECRDGGKIFDLTDSEREVSVKDINTSIVADDRYRLRAVEIIEKHDPQTPLFLYVSFHHPHLPIDPPEEYSSRFNFDDDWQNKYYGMISNLDDNVEHIRKSLVKAGLWENTLFIFASDNGGSPQDIEKSEFSKHLNSPLRGFKGLAFEGAINVPAFISGGFLPHRAKGLQLDDLTSITDWYATLANLVGKKVDDRGPYGSDSIVNWEYILGYKNISARTGLLQFAAMGAAYIEKKWKLLDQPGKPLQLFDLKTDPSEEHDVSPFFPNVVSRLKANFEDPPFQKFIAQLDDAPTCENVGFTGETFQEKVCDIGSDVFLKEFSDDQYSFPGCWAQFRGDEQPLLTFISENFYYD